MENVYKIGEVADLLATTVRTIRYYEEEGLLQPLRTGRGTRLYHERHVARLGSILHLAENGFSLETIRVMASIREGCKTGNESSRKVTARLDSEVQDILARIRDLEALKQEIARAKSVVRRCRGCKNPPTTTGCPECPVITQADHIQILNLVWDQDMLERQ
jgi:DNA-binding transcriptional MerR regulator